MVKKLLKNVNRCVFNLIPIKQPKTITMLFENISIKIPSQYVVLDNYGDYFRKYQSRTSIFYNLDFFIFYSNINNHLIR